METPKKIPFISGNGKPKKASCISGNETFQSTPTKFILFQETEAPQKILIFSPKKAALIFRETEALRNSLFSRNGNAKKLLLFQEVAFQARKMKKTRSENFLYISGNGTFSACYKTRNTGTRNNGIRNISGTAGHPGTAAEQLNITRNTSGTPRNNGTIQNEEQLQCFQCRMQMYFGTV